MFTPFSRPPIRTFAAKICRPGILCVLLICAPLCGQDFSIDEINSDFTDVCVGDELWLISARNLADCQACLDTSQLVCERWINGGWKCASLSQLTTQHKTDFSKETVIYAHGNRTNDGFARYRGIQVYHNLFNTCAARPPIRFVLWAWRSEKQFRRPKRDFEIKSKRAIALGKSFDAALYEFGQHPPLLIGYSLGAQLIAAGLTDDFATGLPSYRLATIAPVLDCDFAGMFYNPLCECQRIESLLVLANSHDRVIRLANHACRRTSGCNFQSFEEWAAGNGSQLGNLRICDVSATSSAKHSIVLYSRQNTVKSEIHQLLLENARSIKLTID